MNKAKKARLEAAGFRFGDAGDFLDLSDAERRLVDTRLAVSRLVRRLRERGGLTQVELAQRINSSQSRVTKIEAAAADVSLDLSFKEVFALGGDLNDLVVVQRGKKSRSMGKRTQTPTMRTKVRAKSVG
jgi:ribosome-binding protein aMBF1 (putative translation factor)